MPGVCVVHLAPYAPDSPFLASLAARPPGIAFELLALFNGFGADGADPEYVRELDGVAHRRLVLPDAVQDLAAYRAAVDATDAEVVCFVNSRAEALADGWLATLVGALDAPGVGMAGASGSWESAFSSAPLELRFDRLRRFGRFPNPHLRTNAFLARRALLLALDWTHVNTKLGALTLESGRRSLTVQVRRRGLRTVVVDRDGRLHEPRDWARSATFRSGGQRGLLVGDNRTRDYLEAGPEERRRLARMAWGAKAAGD